MQLKAFLLSASVLVASMGTSAQATIINADWNFALSGFATGNQAGNAGCHLNTPYGYCSLDKAISGYISSQTHGNGLGDFVKLDTDTNIFSFSVGSVYYGQYYGSFVFNPNGSYYRPIDLSFAYYAGAGPCNSYGSSICTVYLTTNQFSMVPTQIPAGTVPEPATWAMLLAGFGAVGYAMRRNRRHNVAVSFG